MNAQEVFTSDWHFVTVTVDRDADSIKGYINSTNKVTGDTSALSNITSTTQFKIGEDASSRDWEGKVDEVRLSNGTRSPDWIATEYNNQRSPGSFYSVENEEPKPLEGTMFLIR